MNVRNLFVYHCFNEIFLNLKMFLNYLKETAGNSLSNSRTLTQLHLSSSPIGMLPEKNFSFMTSPKKVSSPKTVIKNKLLKIQAKADPLSILQVIIGIFS